MQSAPANRENTWIAISPASRATPLKLRPLPVAMPATWVPWSHPETARDSSCRSLAPSTRRRHPGRASSELRAVVEIAGLRNDLAGQERVVGVGSGVEHRDHLAGAGEPSRPDDIRPDQGDALGQIGPHRQIFLDAHHLGIVGEPPQRLRTDLERHQRHRREGLHVAVAGAAEPRHHAVAHLLDRLALGGRRRGAEGRVGAMRLAHRGIERELDDHPHGRGLAALDELGHGGRIGARLRGLAGRRRAAAWVRGRRGEEAGRSGGAERRQHGERPGERDGARPANGAG